MTHCFLRIILSISLIFPMISFGAKADTLKLNVNTAYPLTITTVGEGVLYILAVTDYKLAVGAPASTTALDILSRPIPPKAIHESIMPVYQALLLLIGNDCRLIVDEKHHLVSMEKL